MGSCSQQRRGTLCRSTTTKRWGRALNKGEELLAAQQLASDGVRNQRRWGALSECEESQPCKVTNSDGNQMMSPALRLKKPVTIAVSFFVAVPQRSQPMLRLVLFSTWTLGSINQNIKTLHQTNNLIISQPLFVAGGVFSVRRQSTGVLQGESQRDNSGEPSHPAGVVHDRFPYCLALPCSTDALRSCVAAGP